LSAQELCCDLQQYLDGDSLSFTSENSIGRVLRQLKRSRHDAQLAQWGVILCWVAPIIMAAETGMYTLCRNGPPYPNAAIHVLRVTQCLLLSFVVWSFRDNWSLKVGTVERQLLSTCFGFFAACVSMLAAEKTAMSLGHISDELIIYVFLFVISGFLFSSLAANNWGHCHTISLVFYAAAPLILLDLTIAPLVFGSCWTIVLLLIGCRLLRHRRSEASE